MGCCPCRHYKHIIILSLKKYTESLNRFHFSPILFVTSANTKILESKFIFSYYFSKTDLEQNKYNLILYMYISKQNIIFVSQNIIFVNIESKKIKLKNVPKFTQNRLPKNGIYTFLGINTKLFF